MKNLQNATRKDVYDYYDWMKKEEYKNYLDNIPLEKIKLSLASCGLNPESICLMGKSKDCGCNTCLMNRKKIGVQNAICK